MADVRELGKIIPKNWNKLLNLKIGDVLTVGDETIAGGFDVITGEFKQAFGTIKKEDLFITFTAFPPPEIEYTKRFTGTGKLPYNFKTTPVKGNNTYSFLHPSSEISERITHTFNNDSSTYSSAMSRIADTANSIVSAWTQVLTGSTKQSVYDVPVLWSNTERREFNIVLSLFAYDDLQEDVYGPINFFRLNSYPKLLKSNEDTFGINVNSALGLVQQPSVFKISGGAFKTFYSQEGDADYGFYNLTNMSVSFNDPGKLYSNGYPMFAKVSLTFQEVIKTYRNFLEKKGITIDIKVKANEITQPTKGKTTVPEFQKPSSIISNFINATGVAKLARNLQERLKNEAIGFALRTIQGSNLFKRFDDAVNIDLRHRIELRNYTHAGFSRSNNIEQEHLDEITQILRKVR